jgi:hypothetical protein
LPTTIHDDVWELRHIYNFCDDARNSRERKLSFYISVKQYQDNRVVYDYAAGSDNPFHEAMNGQFFQVLYLFREYGSCSNCAVPLSAGLYSQQ